LFHQGLGLFAEAKLHTDLRLVAFSEAQGLAETGESGPWQPTMDILYVYKYIYIILQYVLYNYIYTYIYMYACMHRWMDG
jgi:hypothetical protein